MKLYPPLLEGTIPAFYFNNAERIFWDEKKLKEEVKTITAVIVPYEMNKGVSNIDFDSMELKMKMIQNTSNKWQTISSYKVDKENKLAYFDISEVKCDITRYINVGQFYKVQIAYARNIVDDSGVATREIGYYSTVATVKYSAKPKVIINNLDSKDTNSHLYNYIGSYSQSKREFWIFENLLNSQEVIDIIDKYTKANEERLEAFKQKMSNQETNTYALKRFNTANVLRTTFEDDNSYGDGLENTTPNRSLSRNSGPSGVLLNRAQNSFNKNHSIVNAIWDLVISLRKQDDETLQKQVDLKTFYEEELVRLDKLIKELKRMKDAYAATDENNRDLEIKISRFEQRHGTLEDLQAEYDEYVRLLAELEGQIQETENNNAENEEKYNELINDTQNETDNMSQEIENSINNQAGGENQGESDNSSPEEDNQDGSNDSLPEEGEQGESNDSLTEEEQNTVEEESNNVGEYVDNYVGSPSEVLVPYSVSHGGDSAEKVYTYKFDLYDKNRQLIDSTGWQYHDSSTDLEIYESQDVCSFDQDLLKREVYYIQYTVRTINNLVESSPMYRIAQQEVLGPTIDVDIFPKLDFENGRVIISLQGSIDVNGTENSTTGKFRIMRTSDESNYLSWEKVADFQLLGQRPSKYNFIDYTVKHGFNYIYSLQQYNDYGIFSDKVKSKELYVDFEHAFLFDGQKQLKIKYNPKVSSFKNVILESKVDTIGSKYPFITRNGNVNYKEFPISGLISYKMDEEYCFVDREFLKQEVPGTINLIGENIADERNFKIEVLKWLTNGEPKIFRSPSEGNFIIRLLNTSMSPTDSVNRMLHTFTGTAYEIAEYNYKNLVKYGFIDDKPKHTDQVLWKTVLMNAMGGSQNQSKGYGTNLLEYQPIIGIKFEGMVPGDRFYINDGISRGIVTTYYEGEKDKPYKTTKATGYVITIGATGEYNIDIKDGVQINEIVYLSSQDNPVSADYLVSHQGTITYAYLGQPWTSFDNIKHLQMIYNPVEQFRGPYKKLENSETYSMNVLDSIKDIRTLVQDILYIKFICKDKFKIYKKDNKYYDNFAIASSESINIKDLNQEDVIYEVIDLNSGQVVEYIDGYSGAIYDSYSTEISLNGDTMDLSETYEYYTDDFASLSLSGELIIGNGIICEMGYQQVTTSYAFEEEDEFKSLLAEINDIYASRFADQYDINLEYFNDEIRYHINKSIAWQTDIEATDGNNLLSKYENYLSALEQRITEEKER